MAEADDLSVNDGILDDVIEHQIDLLRYGESLREQVLAFLYQLRDDITSQITKADLAGVVRTDWKIARQNALLKQIDANIKTAYRQSTDLLESELLELADIEQSFSIKLINDALATGVASTALTRTDLEQITSEILIQGAVQDEWWDKQSDDLIMRFATQVRMGVAAGESNDEIVRRVRGTATGRDITITNSEGDDATFKEYAGGIMDVTTRDATALVRTSVQTVSNAVNQAVLNDNSDVIKGKLWVSVLDGRTTPKCQAMSGSAWDMDGNVLDESATDFPYTEPPLHWSCRSVIVPITKSWDELMADAGKDKSNIEDIPDSTQSSMDGQVPEALNYDEWLKTKPEAFQKEVLGPGKWELWDGGGGKLTLAQMIDQSGNSLTLDELRAKVKGD